MNDMHTANRIRALRVRAGKSQEEMAKLLGLNAAWYSDLERRDEELASTLTLFQAAQLASLLGVGLHELFGEGTRPGERIALLELPERIVAHASAGGMQIEELEDRIGWDLREFLATPVQVAAEVPIAFLQAIAAELAVDWLSFVPDDDPPE